MTLSYYDPEEGSEAEVRAWRREDARREIGLLREGMARARAEMKPPLISQPGCKIGCSPCSTWCLAKSCMLEAWKKYLVEHGGTLDRPTLSHAGVLYDTDAGRS